MAGTTAKQRTKTIVPRPQRSHAQTTKLPKVVAQSPSEPEPKRRKRESRYKRVQEPKERPPRKPRADVPFTLRGFRTFNTERECLEYFEHLRWNGEPKCPRCASYHVKKFTHGPNAGLLWNCYDCRKLFSVRIGTMFENTQFPLGYWFETLWALMNAKKGLSSHFVARHMHVSQKSAWFMATRLRAMMMTSRPSFTCMVSGYQADESLLGGLEKFKHDNKRIPNAQGRSTKGKAMIFGICSPTEVKTWVVPNSRKKTLHAIIQREIPAAAGLTTDQLTSYLGLGKKFKHQIVNHHKRQYISKAGTHTNSMESHFKRVKSEIMGTHDSVSRKHLPKYLAELDYRYNSKRVIKRQRFNNVLLLAMNTQLKYRELTSKPVYIAPKKVKDRRERKLRQRQEKLERLKNLPWYR